MELIFALIALVTFFLPWSTIAQSAKCTGQSCGIANLSGSTGIPYDATASKLTGGSAAGTKCITDWLTKLGVSIPGGVPAGGAKEAPKTNGMKGMEGMNMRKMRIEKRETCKPNTLLYARGTFEFGALGLTVGPVLQRSLDAAQPGKWSIKGIEYDNGMSGNDCVGLPGGMKCLDVLKATAASCPDTKFVVSGYSQGAMVAHNCVAYADEAIKKRVVGVVAFGDPFNGAPIKGFPSEKIKTFCDKGDGVCDGKFQISAAHMSYSGGVTQEASKWIQQVVGS